MNPELQSTEPGAEREGAPTVRPRPLARRRCFTHASREAVAICPECKRSFCRECVTEHDDRVVCASCLSSMQTVKKKQRSPRWRQLGLLLQGLIALLVLWLIFYSLGASLLNLPTSFHEGDIWEQSP